MKKITGFVALAAVTTTFLISCKSEPKMQVTEGGLVYQIIEDKSGDKYPDTGNIVYYHAKIRIGDSILSNSYEIGDGEPFVEMIQDVPFKGYYAYGFRKITVGDSAIFYMSADSMKKYNPSLSWTKDGDSIVFAVRLTAIKTMDEYKADMQSKMEVQKRKADSMSATQIIEDDKGLQEYFAKNNITPKKTASGLYYTIEKAGSGKNIEAGQMVSAKYTGMLLDGTKFDSNVDPSFGHTDLFKVAAGQGQVIRGWDEGLLLLKKGSKAKFYIPSVLGYGPSGMGDRIPANSNLIFDVEIVDVTASPNTN